MLRSIKLGMLGMPNSIHRDLLCRATGGGVINEAISLEIKEHVFIVQWNRIINKP